MFDPFKCGKELTEWFGKRDPVRSPDLVRSKMMSALWLRFCNKKSLLLRSLGYSGRCFSLSTFKSISSTNPDRHHSGSKTSSCPTYAIGGGKASPLILKLTKKNPHMYITSSWSCYIAKLLRRNVETYSRKVVLQRLTGNCQGGSLSKKQSHLLTRLFYNYRKDRYRAFPRHGKSTLTTKE